MNPRKNLQITRPPKNIQITKGNEVFTPQPKVIPFSPLFFLQNNSHNSPPYESSNFIQQVPVVHFFVSDHDNSKVKALTEQFVNALIDNGINVFIEQYSTHQPGFQVRAASLLTHADFFFQIYSKTAGSGHVRLFESGQPNRMTVEEAIVQIWSTWRFKNAALSPEEVNLLSNEKIIYLLNEYAGIEPPNMDITSIQTTAQEIIENGVSVRPLIDKLMKIDTMLQDGQAKINSTQIIGYQRKKSQGRILKQITEDKVRGISQPLKDALLSIIDHTSNKVKAIIGILNSHDIVPQVESYSNHDTLYNSINEPSDSDQKIRDGSSWRDMIESADDNVESMRIPSYGDGTVDAIHSPFILLDDY